MSPGHGADSPSEASLWQRVVGVRRGWFASDELEQALRRHFLHAVDTAAGLEARMNQTSAGFPLMSSSTPSSKLPSPSRHDYGEEDAAGPPLPPLLHGQEEKISGGSRLLPSGSSICHLHDLVPSYFPI